MSSGGEERIQERDRRKFVRKTVVWIAYISWAEGRTECIVDNVSAGGSRIRPIHAGGEISQAHFALDIGTLVKFEIIGLAHARARIAWREPNVMGLYLVHVPEWAMRLA